MSRQIYEGLHGKVIRVPGTEIVLTCEHVEKERTRITVHWLSPTYPLEAVKAVVGALTGDEQAEVFKLRNREGQWGALCCPVKEIPHYALVEAPGRPNGWHTIKITIPGRLSLKRHLIASQPFGEDRPQHTPVVFTAHRRLRNPACLSRSASPVATEFGAYNGTPSTAVFLLTAASSCC